VGHFLDDRRNVRTVHGGWLDQEGCHGPARTYGDGDGPHGWPGPRREARQEKAPGNLPDAYLAGAVNTVIRRYDDLTEEQRERLFDAVLDGAA
jgi:hypothetical protein